MPRETDVESPVRVFETKVTQTGNSVAIPVTGDLRDEFDPDIKAGNRLLSVTLARGVMLCIETTQSEFKGIHRQALIRAMETSAPSLRAAFAANIATALSPAKREIEADPLTAALLGLVASRMSPTELKDLPDFDPRSFGEALGKLRPQEDQSANKPHSNKS